MSVSPFRRYRVLAIETRTHENFVCTCSEGDAKQQAAELWDTHGDKSFEVKECDFEVVYIEEAL